MASSPAGSAGVPQKQPVAHVIVTGSGSLLVNTAGIRPEDWCCRTLYWRSSSPLARNFGVMPTQAFLQQVQAFLAELKARPHLLAEAAALMEREGGLECPGLAKRCLPFKTDPQGRHRSTHHL